MFLACSPIEPGYLGPARTPGHTPSHFSERCLPEATFPHTRTYSLTYVAHCLDPLTIQIVFLSDILVVTSRNTFRSRSDLSLRCLYVQECYVKLQSSSNYITHFTSPSEVPCLERLGCDSQHQERSSFRGITKFHTMAKSGG